jgi:hypothetical protein
MRGSTSDPVPEKRSFEVPWAILIGVLAAGALAMIRSGFPSAASVPQAPDPTSSAIVLWAWERPEDLRFADPSRVSVAYLAGTILLEGDEVLTHPRRQPLRVAEGSRVIPVIRIEAGQAAHPSLTDSQAGRAAAAIAGLAGETIGSSVGLTGRNAPVQIDFDASASQRVFYRRLLFDLRRRLPAERKISITALASWCDGDRWLDGLPVDEAVPMLFRMGPDGPAMLRRLQAGRALADPRCRGSVGVSTDEGGGWLFRADTTYVFHPRSWDMEAVNAALRRQRRLE